MLAHSSCCNRGHFSWCSNRIFPLHTNIPQADIISSHSQRVARVLALITAVSPSSVDAPRTRIRISVDPDSFELVANWTSQPVVSSTTELVFELASYSATFFEPVLSNSFLEYAGRVYHQRTGIPMGLECAVFVANDTLWWYEFQFFQQLASLQQLAFSAVRQAASVQQRAPSRHYDGDTHSTR